jgi:hypothetical protein
MKDRVAHRLQRRAGALQVILGSADKDGEVTTLGQPHAS